MSQDNHSPSPSFLADQVERISLRDNDARLDDCLHGANELKAEGNGHFRVSNWDEALVAYRAGLGRLPKRKDKRNDGLKGKAKLDGDNLSYEEEETIVEERDEEEFPETDLERQCAKARAVLNANIGACYDKLGDHKLSVDACTQALLDDPAYVKALQRRATSNERINSWSSLTSAQEDYSTLLKLLPSSSPQTREIERLLQHLIPRVEAAQKKETTEMLDKLKGLGNTILGNFGLSTNNFKFEPNGQGGYSMNFSR